MKILAVGGGSGGHVTPVVAVLRELKNLDSDAQIRFWCDRKFAPQARAIMGHFDDKISVQTIVSGKLRRYHTLPWWRQLLRPFTIVLPNIRDLFLVGVGTVQSVVKLLAWRPDVVFSKGGYVCLPVGLAAKFLGIPLVIHDSDAHPGLTSRILARFATSIATGAPLKYYSYDAKKSRYTGVPVREGFTVLTDSQRRHAKQKLGVDPKRPLIVVTGGGLGAQRINDAVAATLSDLLSMGSVILISGTAHYDGLRATTPEADDRFQLHAFISDGWAEMLGAADIVVARAGATSTLELAALATPTILVPNSYLTGGHQLKNAAMYAEKGAVVIIDEHQLEADPTILTAKIAELLIHPARRKQMSKAFHAFSKPDAAKDVANMIRQAAKRS